MMVGKKENSKMYVGVASRRPGVVEAVWGMRQPGDVGWVDPETFDGFDRRRINRFWVLPIPLDERSATGAV